MKRILCFAILISFASSLQAGVLTSSERGWYNNSGFHNPSNANYFAGISDGHRNFFVFDLSSVTDTITSARLKLFNPSNGGPSSANGLYTVFDVSTSIASIVNGTGGLGAFNDFGSGVTYATKLVMPADQGTTVTVEFDAAGIAALNAAAGGQFATGGRFSSSFSNFVFGFTGSGNPADGASVLEFETSSGVVPEPTSFATWGLLVGAVAAVRRRRK